MTFQSINPTTGEPFATYDEWPTEVVQDVVGKVHRDYLAWRQTGFDHRASLMRNAADILNRNARDYAKLMAEEMGKPLQEGVAEAEKCAKLASTLLKTRRTSCHVYRYGRRHARLS